MNTLFKDTLRTFITLSILYALALSFTKVTFTLFLFDKGFTKLETNFIFSTFNLSVIFLEPLTAPIAELMSKKKSFIIGCVLKIITVLLFIFLESFNGMVVAEIVSGLASAFISGCLTAWFFDEIRNKPDLSEKSYRILTLVSRYKSICTILGALLGSYLGNTNLDMPWLASGIFFAILAIIGQKILTEKEEKEVEKEIVSKKLNRIKLLLSNYKNIISDRFILFLLSSSFISGMGLISLQMFRIPLIKSEFHLTTFQVGMIWILIESSRIIGTFFVNKYYDLFPIPIKGLIYVPFLSASFLIFAKYFANSYLMIFFFFLFEFLMPFYSTLKDYLLSKRNLSIGRVTVLSLENSIDKIGDVIGLLFIGWLADQFSMDIAWYTSSLIFSFSAYMYYCAYRQQKLDLEKA
jgi:DHA3 family tetracycline resistance protein-like MFS transporter